MSIMNLTSVLRVVRDQGGWGTKDRWLRYDMKFVCFISNALLQGGQWNPKTSKSQLRNIWIIPRRRSQIT